MNGINMKIVALTSGGIDSAVLINALKLKRHEVHPLFLNYGQISSEREWKACVEICEHIALTPYRLDIPGFGKHIRSGITDQSLDITKDAFLPTRNLFFLTVASAYAFSKDIYTVAIGLISDPIFPDQTSTFLEKAKDCISEALEADIRIMSPLLNLSKMQIYLLAEKYDVPIKSTYYCHAGSEVPCGECIACQEHINVLKLLDTSKYL